MLPNYLPIDLMTEEGVLDVTLLTVQAAIINQIVQVTRGTLVLDEALNAIANQMQDTLHASGCLIFQSDGCQPKAASQISGMITQQDSSGVAIANSDSLSFPCKHPEIAERLYKIGSDVYQYFHSWLAQGKSVILPRIEPQLLPALNCGGESGFCAVLIVPMLYRQSYLGSLNTP